MFGGGRMGGDIAIGLVKQGLLPPCDITISHPKSTLQDAFEGMHLTRSNIEAVEGAQLIILSVKPWLVEEVLREVAPHIDPQRQQLLSVVAGLSFESLRTLLHTDQAMLYRIIPNTAISLGKSVTLIASEGVSRDQLNNVIDMFSTLGDIFEVSEDDMSSATSLTSCGIAFALRYLDAAARGGESVGIPYRQSLAMTISTMEGAIELLRHNESLPQDEIDKVTTKGGITLKGLSALEREGFEQGVIAAIKESR